jgi:hypothetical protein
LTNNYLADGGDGYTEFKSALTKKKYAGSAFRKYEKISKYI